MLEMPPFMMPGSIRERVDHRRKQRTLEASMACTAKGRFKVMVVQPLADGGEEVVHVQEQDNLILDSGLDNLATRRWRAMLDYCAAGTGTTPTTDLTESTYTQSGTTVTRASGAYTFSNPADVGKLLRFDTGEEAYITSVTSGTVVEVGTSATVGSPTNVNLYRVAQTGLTGEVKRTNSYHSTGNDETVTRSTNSGTVALRRTYNFTAEASDRVYTEIGVSHSATAGANLFSRILLDGSVTVLGPSGGNPGQQLRVEYTLTITVTGGGTARQAGEIAVTGWPFPYDISSITSNGTTWTVTTATDHHFATAGTINIDGAIPAKQAIVDATSDATDFFIECTGHGYSVGDRITIEGMTPSGYNGDWEVSVVTDADNFEIANTANPGALSVAGTVRYTIPPQSWAITAASSTGSDFTITAPGHDFEVGSELTISGMTPAGYNGSWTVASVSGDDFTVTDSSNPGVGTVFGTATWDEQRWFDGEWTISATPTATTLQVNRTEQPPAAGDDGTIYNDLTGLFAVYGGDMGIRSISDVVASDNTYEACVMDPQLGRVCTMIGSAGASFNLGNVTLPANFLRASSASTSFAQTSYTTAAAYVNGNRYVEWSLSFGTSAGNFDDIKYICLSRPTSDSGTTVPASPYVGWLFIFNEPQIKTDSYTLTLVFRLSFGRNLA